MLADLEKTFRAPVLEAYGMTEAAHQMASNPLPPRVRKPGAVGLAAGPDIAVMDASGRMLRAGETGEVVIRGPNVTRATKAIRPPRPRPSDGWFRTGDQGWIDAEGYLRLTGRLKELINRGAEKIAPREVDEVLLGHPAVRQAVCFAVAHAPLGEDVGAVIRFLDEIPKGPTGKLQRVGWRLSSASTRSMTAVARWHWSPLVAPRNEPSPRSGPGCFQASPLA